MQSTDIFNLVSVTCDTAPLPSLEETLGILFPEAYPLRLQEGLVVRLGRVPGGWESGVGPTDYKWAAAVTWPGGWHDDCITIPDEDVQQVRAHLESGDVLVYLQTHEEGEPALTLALIPPPSDRAPSEPATAPDAPAAPSPLPASPDPATAAPSPRDLLRATLERAEQEVERWPAWIRGAVSTAGLFGRGLDRPPEA